MNNYIKNNKINDNNILKHLKKINSLHKIIYKNLSKNISNLENKKIHVDNIESVTNYRYFDNNLIKNLEIDNNLELLKIFNKIILIKMVKYPNFFIQNFH